VLCTEDAEYEVYSLSLAVSSWPACRPTLPREIRWRIPSHRGSPSLAMSRHPRQARGCQSTTMTGPSSSGWARRSGTIAGLALPAPPGRLRPGLSG
jgi:hypothetical protein